VLGCEKARCGRWACCKPKIVMQHRSRNAHSGHWLADHRRAWPKNDQGTPIAQKPSLDVNVVAGAAYPGAASEDGNPSSQAQNIFGARAQTEIQARINDGASPAKPARADGVGAETICAPAMTTEDVDQVPLRTRSDMDGARQTIRFCVSGLEPPVRLGRLPGGAGNALFR